MLTQRDTSILYARPASAAAIAAVLFALAFCFAPARAAEPWANEQLVVTEGLFLWLDASSVNRAREAARFRTLSNGEAVAVWHDASGNARHVVQRTRDAQPRFVMAGEHTVVRFDGQDDFLGLAGLKTRARDLTLLVVAAPRSNVGYFRAFAAVNETGRNDYVTGMTLDQGGGATARFESLNPEGVGFGGARDLMTSSHDFGTFHVLTMTSTDGEGGTKLYVDGALEGQRDRTDSQIAVDEVTIGARCYSNSPEPAFVSGFLDGDIAEVLLYDRVLTDEELAKVHRYLTLKHAGLGEALDRLSANHTRRLVPVDNPPAVQMFVPGFAARELPVRVSNVNNVRYRADGRLVALTYDGRVLLLSDSDGDGLEDKVATFYDGGSLEGTIGMALTPPGYALGDGVFVAAKGKCVLIVDTDGDDRADRTIVVADGWKELPHGVDALGVAVDRDGSVLFGLGTADYTNAYLIDSNGKARYDLAGERGTIMRVAPDFSRREIVCTGIRFPVGLALNRAGDLFCTDQEGATWLPNGNPFDELLHIEKGRHYGFPPRHVKHLPSVIDEPSLFDYKPQHQSTCGLIFNESVADGGKAFGPDWWRGDALVCGYSRGKLYRTKLVKTGAGYVAQNSILACLNMLTVDSCVAPDGELVVSVHSGGPDWGSGPRGEGKLYKIAYADRETPQPVAVWAGGPSEVCVAFDRPLTPEQLLNLSRQVSIEYGPYVAAGDRFESLRPGYEAVQYQLAAPRYELAVQGVSVTPDRRTVLLATDEQSQNVSYALTLSPLADSRALESDAAPTDRRTLPPHSAEIDLAYRLTGASASWRGDSGGTWSGWLPHLDLTVARAFTEQSAEHERLWPLLEEPGRLTLSAQLDLWHMLRPAVQPGSKIDYEWPEERVTVCLSSSVPLVDVKSADGYVAEKPDKDGRHLVELTFDPRQNEPMPITFTLLTGGTHPDLVVSYFTNEDDRRRALPLERILLPFARAGDQPHEAPDRSTLPELAGGDWLRGREVFYSVGQCSKCHTVRGTGGHIGPDLSNLIHRDVPSVLRDIEQPSFAINPEFLSYAITLNDGRVLSGSLRVDGDTLYIGDKDGREKKIARDDIDEMAPLAISTMPEGLPKTLGPDAMKDVLAFLMLPGPEVFEPAKIEATGAPPPRTWKEVRAVLGENFGKSAADQTPDSDDAPASAEPPASQEAEPRPLHVVLVAGPKDHGPGEHDYPLWLRRWSQLLALAQNVRVTTADRWPSDDDLASADVLVFYSANPDFSPEKAAQIEAFQKRGGGLVLLHYAVNGQRAPDRWADHIGLAWQDGHSRFRHGALLLDFDSAGDHPIARGFGPTRFVDESYWELLGDPESIHVLAAGEEEGKPRPLLWTYERAKGRVFVSILGHYSWTFDDPLFRILVLRGICWTGRQPVDRLSELSTIGARIVDDDQSADR